MLQQVKIRINLFWKTAERGPTTSSSLLSLTVRVISLWILAAKILLSKSIKTCKTPSSNKLIWPVVVGKMFSRSRKANPRSLRRSHRKTSHVSKVPKLSLSLRLCVVMISWKWPRKRSMLIPRPRRNLPRKGRSFLPRNRPRRTKWRNKLLRSNVNLKLASLKNMNSTDKF